jgi:hypothetical protein
MEGSGSGSDVGNGAAQSYCPAGAKESHKNPQLRKSMIRSLFETGISLVSPLLVKHCGNYQIKVNLKLICPFLLQYNCIFIKSHSPREIEVNVAVLRPGKGNRYALSRRNGERARGILDDFDRRKICYPYQNSNPGSCRPSEDTSHMRIEIVPN